MRCAEYTPKSTQKMTYTCGSCYMFYKDYSTLLEHLYWRHGTESEFCGQCSMRKWSYAIHICLSQPTSDVYMDEPDCDEEDTEVAEDSSHDTEINKERIEKETVKANKTEEIIVIPVEIPEDSDSDESTYFSDRESEFCYCGKFVPDSQMIGCDREDCSLQWYHFQCVGVTTAPTGDWYCPECKNR